MAGRRGHRLGMNDAEFETYKEPSWIWSACHELPEKWDRRPSGMFYGAAIACGVIGFLHTDFHVPMWLLFVAVAILALMGMHQSSSYTVTENQFYEIKAELLALKLPASVP
jgi:hypothetical protein